MGQERTVEDVKDNCTPVIMNSDLKNGTTFLNGTPVSSNPSGVASPCGLIAKSVFTDTFTLRSPAGVVIPIDSSNIAWKSDVEYKYKQAENAASTQWLNVTDCKFLNKPNSFRALHCMDAHGWPAKLQKAVRSHRLRSGKG
jgi:hypothetical protein